MAIQAPTRNPVRMTELHERFDNCLLVKLLWFPLDNEIWLSVKDQSGVINEGEILLTRVPNDEAMEAFWHPFCYIASAA
jgi:hypothetical protein